MKRILNFILVSFLCSALNAQNIITNPGFESGATGWTTFSTNTLVTSETPTSGISHAGTSSFKINVNSSSLVSAGALQTHTVIPLQHYLLEYYVKTDSVNGSVFPYFNFGDTSVNYEYGLFPVTGTTGWQRFQSRFTIPAGSNNNLVFFLIFSGTKGTAYFDDVSLTRLTDTTWSNFTINIISGSGLIKNFQGTNTGPTRSGSSIDLTANFQQTGINFVRTHDYYGACDISTIFPDTTKSAMDSTAYNFNSSDSVITSIINAGGKVLFRLGESFEATPIHNAPPLNMIKWGDVCVQIAKHYNQGWKNGFYYNIKEWEIWNEPDGNSFWSGSVNDFVKLYRIASQKLKQHDPTFVVGGPAIASLNSISFLNTFLDSVNTENLPFDFFSYHMYYIANPYHFKYADSLAKALLLSHGLSTTKTYVTEWNPLNYSGNISQLGVWHNDPYISSQAASAMSYWQDNGPDKVFWYRTDEYLFGLFDENTGQYHFSGRAFDAVNNLNFTPNRLNTTGGDNLGKTILAGVSNSGDSINVLISDHAYSSTGYNLNLSNIASLDNYSYEIYRVVVSDSLTRVSTGVVASTNNTISVGAIAPYTDLIRLTKISSVGTSENTANRNTFLIYPNPANDFIYIYSNNKNLNETFEIYSITGTLIKQFNVTNQIKLDISNLEGGMYFIRSKGKANKVIKIIKL